MDGSESGTRVRAASAPLIFDVGMHRGEDSEFYLKKGFRVVAVEAVAEFCAEASQRFAAEVEDGSLRIVNCAIAARAGPVAFHLNEKKSVWGTADPHFLEVSRVRDASTRVVEVAGRCFADLMRDVGVPYYLKVDIEGADRLCIEALAQFEERPRYLSVEAETASWERLVADVELMSGLGYDAFKLVQQRDVPRQRCPVPPREGRQIDHRFAAGSSGAFGEEAPGQWLDLATTIERLRPIFRRQRWFGSGGLLARGRVSRVLIRDILHLRPGWYDIHARLGVAG